MAKYPVVNGKFFVNPYIFSGINNKKITKHAEGKDEENLLTGEIKCRMIIKTPLIIPDAIEKKVERLKNNKEHYKFPFMRINGKLEIPGSSIRGPLRSVYETLTDSCFSTVKNNQIITMRTMTDFKPVLLTKKGDVWELYEASRHLIKKNDKALKSLNYGDAVVFTAVTKKNRSFVKTIHKTKKNIQGYVYKGEGFSKKKYESVFSIGKKKKIQSEIIKKAFKRLEATKEVYNDAAINKNLGKSHKGYDQIDLSKFKESKNMTIPVWCHEEGGNLYLSLACIGRYGFGNTMNDILGSRDKCSSRKEACMACRLFGLASDEDEGGLGSLVRVSDAILVNGCTSKLKYTTIKELATPRPSYLPFYLKKFNTTLGYDTQGLEIQGRKYYWHHKPVFDEDYNVAKSNLNATMEIMESGKFEFSVYYNNIIEGQLKELIWLLCLGDNREESNLCYKMGHGKPLGYGSVKIVVDKVYSRNYHNKTCNYEVKERQLDIEKPSSFVEKWKYLEPVMDYNTMSDMDVRYPYIDSLYSDEPNNKNDLAAHQWFGENFKLGGKSPQDVLPQLLDKDYNDDKGGYYRLPVRRLSNNSEITDNDNDTERPSHKNAKEAIIVDRKKDSNSSNKNSKSNKKNNRNYQASSRHRSVVSQNSFVVGQEYEGKVIVKSETGRTKVEVNGCGIIMLNIGRDVNIGETIRVKCTSKTQLSFEGEEILGK